MTEDLVLIDWLSLLLLTAFGITGFFNGFIKEVFAAAAWIVSLIISWFLGPSLFPMIGSYIGTPEITKAVSFLSVFLSCFSSFDPSFFLRLKIPMPKFRVNLNFYTFIIDK